MEKVASIFLTGALLLAGCSPDAYRRSADRQVDDILRQREQTALGYQPQVSAPTTVDPTPPPRAYDKIPVTPLPPPVSSPMEPMRTVVTDAPLGPPPPTTAPALGESPDLYGMQSTVRPGGDNLTLGPPAPGATGVRLDLFGALEYGIQHSRAYQTRMEDLYLSALDVTLARHLFEPRPFVRTGLLYTGGQADVNYRSALNATAAAGVRQQLPYGGEVVAEALVGFVNAINGNVNDGETAELALSGSLPLLRGAGMVNLEPLISGERELVYRIRDFESFRRSFAVNLAQEYFNLLRVQQSVANRRLNHRNLATLTARTQALYEAGKISFLEVQRSLQSLLQAESSLINAQEDYQTALDRFKITLGMPIEQDLDLLGVQLDVEVPQMGIDRAIALAMTYRLSLRTAEDRIDDARRAVAVARNGLLAGLDLTGRIGAGNRFDRSAVNLDSRTLTYEAGITLDLPIDRLAERNALRRQLIQLQRAMRNLEQEQSQVAVNTSAALREIRSARQNLRIQQLGIDLARRRLDYANELLKEGKTTARELVEAQSSLLSAQDAFDQAKASLQISVLQFLEATGTLRVDPRAGALGLAMDRAAARNQQTGANNPAPPR